MSASVTGGPARRSTARRVLQVLVVAVFVAFLVVALVRRWTEVRAVLGQLSVQAMAVACAAAFAAIWASFLCWRAVLADLSGTVGVPLTGAMRIFFVGQAGKYVPGAVWPILTQTRLGKEYDVPPRASSAAAAIFMLMILGSGLLVAVVCLPLLGGARAAGRYWWALLALPAAAVLLWPPVLNRLVAAALRLARRQSMPRPLTFAGVARSAGWSLVMWALFGTHLWALLRDLGAHRPALLLVAMGAYAASWSIGFLLVLAPAGAGPREVALILLLGPTLAAAPATVAALVSRLIITVGDLGWSGVAIVAERRRKRALARQARSPLPVDADVRP